MTRTARGLALLGILALPPARHALESLMATHMGVQMPLLVLAGYWLARGVAPRCPRWLAETNACGVPGALLAGFTLAFWMLPRWLDGALDNGWIELAKFLALTLLAGVPLGLSWQRLGPVVRGFVQFNVLSMLGFMSWLYMAAPSRLCNNYLFDQQALLGWTLLGWTGVLAIAWAARPLFGAPAASAEPERPAPASPPDRAPAPTSSPSPSARPAQERAAASSR